MEVDIQSCVEACVNGVGLHRVWGSRSGEKWSCLSWQDFLADHLWRGCVRESSFHNSCHKTKSNKVKIIECSDQKRGKLSNTLEV